MGMYWSKPARGGRRVGGVRPGWKRLGGLAAAAAAMVALVPGSALAASVSSGSSDVAVGAGAHKSVAARGASEVHAGTVASRAATPPLTRRLCSVPAQPGVAACDAIVRTDAASRQGRLAPGTLPQGYGPADLQSAYKLPSATAGAGATVAVVDAYDDPSAAADLAVYRKQFGLPPCTVASGCFRKVNQAGGTTPPARSLDWSGEISLDLDMVSAACPKCHILLVEASSADFTDLGTAANEAVALGAKYVSNSYSTDVGAGAALETQWDAQYYNHPGVVITAASGDYGWNFPPYASFPADSPHVVAVGGTSLTRDPSSPRGWSETVWGPPGGGGTGSGCGAMPAPSWQQNLTGNPCPGLRAYSDVSAVADPYTGVAVYDSFPAGGWQVFGGTSASSPLIAASYALAGRPVGGTYPAASLYTAAGHASLNDVTTGNNNAGDTSCGVICTAGPGWDGPTGWGTPDGVSDFAAGPHGTVTGTVTSGGAPVAGAQVLIGTATAVTNRAGHYATTVLDGSYTPSASRYGYATQTAGQITVTSGGTVTQNFTLAKQPLATVTGTVRDASGQGWPLYAEVTVPGTPVTSYTNPVTGKYSLQLPVTGKSYTLHVSAQFAGYLAADTQVTPAAGGLHQDVGLAADPLGSNCPAGYQEQAKGLSQNFSSGTTPPGWKVTTTGPVHWVFNNPQHLPNLTGGTGGFALADGVSGHPYGGNQSTTMTSPVFNLSTVKAPALKFDQSMFLDNAFAGAAVELSTDGGFTWSPVYQEGALNSPVTIAGPDTEVFPLPQAAGLSAVRLEFTGVTLNPSSTWEVDNVLAGQLSCRPVPGGLVTGIVRDKNTGQPVNGATVSGGGQRVTTTPEPGDPAVGGGLYQLFAPAGSQSLTVTAGGYSAGAATVTVGAGTVTRADVPLAAGRLSVTPGSVPVKTVMGGTATASVKVTNTGSAPVTIDPAAQAGPVTVAGQAPRQAGMPSGPATPLRRVPGHFSPAAGLAAVSGPLRQRMRELRSQMHRAGTTGGSGPGPWVPPWVPATHYPEYGYDMTAATDPATGTVYSAGGNTSATYTYASAEAYAYDPATGAWSRLPDMPDARSAGVAGVIGGKLYVTGGYAGDGLTNLPALDVYDPHTRLWSRAAPIPHPYYGSASAVLDGKWYVVGGCFYTSVAQNDVCASTRVQVYNPATGAWTQAAAYPVGAGFLGCGAISGKLYCAGGDDNNLQGGTTAAYVYDPAAGKWSPVASMPSPLWAGASAAANGQLLLSGGIGGTPPNQYLTNQGYIYNPVTNTWSALPNAPDATYRGGSACGFYTIAGIDAAGYPDNVAQLPGYTGCDGGAGVGWLTTSPAQLTLAPGQSATVRLTVNASLAQVPQPGTYAAAVALYSGAPYLTPRVPVTLTATPPGSWAELTGVISGRSCGGTVAPVDGATVQVHTRPGGGWTLATGPDGKYVRWLPASDGPVSLIVTAPGWLAKTATAKLRPGAVTTASLTLSRASCG